MLGAPCNPCCDPCACPAGQLPETVTVSFSGFSQGSTQGPHIAFLSFESDFGSGASGRLTSPGGNPETDAGPVAAAEITSGGEGYARIARVQPTVTASRSGGSGAIFSVTLSEIEYDGRPAWEVASVAVTGGGTGHADGALSFSAGTGGTEQAAAYAIASTGRLQPTVAASVSGGTGSGAELSLTLAQSTDWEGKTIWAVDSLSIEEPGEGYAEYDEVTFTVTDGQGGYYGASAYVSSVDENGGITGVSLSYGGEYYKSSGVLESVTVYSGGTYYKDDATIPGEAANVTVSVVQSGPTAPTASGAVLEAVIDTDPQNATFGQITGVTVEDGGDNYLAWAYCESYVDGSSVVLKRPPDGCVYANEPCISEAGLVRVFYNGPSQPPTVTVTSGECSFSLAAESAFQDCSSFSFTASDASGRSVTVTAGGEYPVSGGACDVCTGTIGLDGVDLTLEGPWVVTCVEKNQPRPEGWEGWWAHCAIRLSRARMVGCVYVNDDGEVAGEQQEGFQPMLLIAIDTTVAWTATTSGGFDENCDDYGYDKQVGDELECINGVGDCGFGYNLIFSIGTAQFAFGPLFGTKCLLGPRRLNPGEPIYIGPCTGQEINPSFANLTCGQ